MNLSTAATKRRRSGTLAAFGVVDARAARRISAEVALVTLVADAPQLGGRVAAIGEELREGQHAAERVAGGGKWRVVVAVDEDHRRAFTAPAAPKPISGLCSEVSSIAGNPSGSVVPTVPPACASVQAKCGDAGGKRSGPGVWS